MQEEPINPLKIQVLELLQDQEVQEKMFQWLTNMFKRHEVAILDQKYQAMQEELQNHKDLLLQREKELLHLQELNQQKQEELERTKASLKHAQAEIEKHKIKPYELFLTLPHNAKQGLSNLFKEGDPLAFIVVGTQGKNIEMLWDYTNNMLKENAEGASTLVEIFYAFFAYYEQATPYQLDSLEVGQNYDPTKHQLHCSSTHASGKITDILLKGFMHAKSGEIKRQSVVKV
ncbi:hypothetical protein [Helicobacter suis]|uniref:hypothetical protein n=1 Tax=Helicobacter suis TaxID=104628 RepID=UPI0013D51610|nr:hypothetical protein [Helicobacter suis]